MSCYEVVRDANGKPVKVVDSFSGRRMPEDEEGLILAQVAEEGKKTALGVKRMGWLHDLARASVRREVAERLKGAN